MLQQWYSYRLFSYLKIKHIKKLGKYDLLVPCSSIVKATEGNNKKKIVEKQSKIKTERKERAKHTHI